MQKLVDIDPMDKKFKSLADMEKYFNYGFDCREYLERLRWQGGVVSPYSGLKDVKRIGYSDRFVCLETNKVFSALSGTIFSNAKIDLIKWFQVAWLHWQHPDLSSLAIAKQVDVNQKTVWNMLRKIKKAEDVYKSKSQ